MSDLVIPGTGTSRYNTKELVDLSMQRERIALTRMTTERERASSQRVVWQDMNAGVTRLRDSASTLFGFQNPFQEKSARTSDERVMTAAATRAAGNEARSVTVNRLATSDRLLSRPTDRSLRVEPGTYTFRIGERVASFTYAGGTLPAFVDTLNRRVGTDLKASLLRDTRDTNVLLLEAVATGSENRLVFADKARDLAVDIGLIAPTDARTYAADLAGARPTGAPAAVRVQDGEMTLAPGGAARLPVTPPFALDPQMVLELEVRVADLPRSSRTTVPAPPGPDLPTGDTVDFRGLRLENAPSSMPLPVYTPPEPPPLVEDLSILSIESGVQTVALPESEVTSRYQRVRIPVGTLTDSVSALVFTNRNTYREVSVRDLRIYDPAARGDARPLNALAEAGDAEITVDGVKVTRPTNVVDDLIPGVTLTLRAPSTAPVDLTVQPNADLIKDRIVEFVGRYNQVLTEIDVLTRRDPAVVDEAYYTTEEERTKAAGRLGLLAGDMTLARLKTTLSGIAMNPYPTGAGEGLSLLAQIGISTNAAGPGSGTLDRTRLRGYLEIDEPRLDQVLRGRTADVRQIFGSDTDGDLVVDAGAAFAVDQLLRGYTGRGGVIGQRVATIDTEITQRDRQIGRENERLEQTEADLRQKYAQMEGALQSLEDSSRRIEGFNQQNQ
jgi:flagellar hook-associated protein 2